jgi:class 3 adenylate cyclase
MPAIRRLAAIFAADVVGCSRLMGDDEEGTLDRLKAHRRDLIDPKIDEHRGRIIKTTGDGLLAEFASSVVDAVRCTVEIQRGMIERDVMSNPSDRPKRVPRGTRSSRPCFPALSLNQRMLYGSSVGNDFRNRAFQAHKNCRYWPSSA